MKTNSNVGIKIETCRNGVFVDIRSNIDLRQESNERFVFNEEKDLYEFLSKKLFKGESDEG